jgi:DNA-directed RNA polymerase specialized sigma24 family protein
VAGSRPLSGGGVARHAARPGGPRAAAPAGQAPWPVSARPIEEALTVCAPSANPNLVAIDLALSRFEKEEPEKAQVVEMRFFGGMTEEEIAAALGVTPRTVRRYWAYAQARLYEELTGTDG